MYTKTILGTNFTAPKFGFLTTSDNGDNSNGFFLDLMTMNVLREPHLSADLQFKMLV